MNSDRFYKVNMTRLGVLLLPVALRGQVVTSLVRVMLTPLSMLAVLLNKFRDEKLTEIKTTGQVRILRNTLNERLDMVQRRIEIADGKDGVPTYVRARGVKPICFVRQRYSDTTTFVMKRGLTSGGLGFVVKLPRDVYGDAQKLAEAKSLVSKHHLAGTTYDITVKD